MIEELEAIGYASGSETPRSRSGVTRRNVERSAAGHIFLTSGHAPEALLLDADGKRLHRWAKPFQSIWPDARVPGDGSLTTFWRRARLLPNGDVIAIFDGLGIFKIDRDSKLIWANLNQAHHDFDIAPDGRIWVLTRKARMLPAVNTSVPILEDFISVLGADGRTLRSVSVLKAFENSPYAPVARAHYARGGDLFHINTLELLDGRIADKAPAFQSGSVLISSFPLHVIGVLDMQQETISWLQRGSYRNQHDPQLLANGHLLLFDNQGQGAGSSIQEIDPVSGGVVWQYTGSAHEPFFSRTCGTVQRLPNGNTLVSESDSGRAFEITAAGEIVWEYINPYRAGTQGEFIATIFEAWRLPDDYPADWLAAGPGGGTDTPQLP
jgi:hypothetical protein